MEQYLALQITKFLELVKLQYPHIDFNEIITKPKPKFTAVQCNKLSVIALKKICNQSNIKITNADKKVDIINKIVNANIDYYNVKVLRVKTKDWHSLRCNNITINLKPYPNEEAFYEAIVDGMRILFQKYALNKYLAIGILENNGNTLKSNIRSFNKEQYELLLSRKIPVKIPTNLNEGINVIDDKVLQEELAKINDLEDSEEEYEDE